MRKGANFLNDSALIFHSRENTMFCCINCCSCSIGVNWFNWITRGIILNMTQYCYMSNTRTINTNTKTRITHKYFIDCREELVRIGRQFRLMLQVYLRWKQFFVDVIRMNYEHQTTNEMKWNWVAKEETHRTLLK